MKGNYTMTTTPRVHAITSTWTRRDGETMSEAPYIEALAA